MVKDTSPYAAGFVQPAEWAQHAACYTAWPAHEYAWGPHLRSAQLEFIAFAQAFAADAAQEPLHVLVDAEYEAQARAALAHITNLVFVRLPYGDVWLRDTAPIFVKTAAASDTASGARDTAALASVRFRWNGWGDKYLYPHDPELAARIAQLHPEPRFAYDFVLEGGSIDVDGLGTGLTTRSCLLNANRGAPTQAQAAARLREALGITQLIWLDAGLQNDHTDGHIDNIARFVAPGVVVCMQAHDDDDPNRETLDAIAAELAKQRDARGAALKVVRIPSPGRVLGADGAVLPASHMNFYIGNATVLLPVFGTRWDEPARAALQALFPGRKVVPCSARAILEGGGTFHCMTQQVPAVTR